MEKLPELNNLMAARSQMALSLGFHIIFSCIGMVMPFMMARAHYLYLKTGQILYFDITKAWSKGVAIFFATGAVSGTVLSFEMGLLWPKFMDNAGPIFGMPFSLEGTAFFIEAIALGFYLYGWKKFNRWFHWATGVVVGITGVLSGILVVAANSWMNSPTGFNLVNGQYTHIDPYKAMFNKAWFPEAMHMVIAAFAATAFAVAGVHAFLVIKGKHVAFHRKAFSIAMPFAVVAATIQPFSGDLSAKFVARNQPAKLAAMESHFKTGTDVPLIIGGIPDADSQKVNYAIKIPGMLSLMAKGNIHAAVTGLDKFPKSEQPPVAVVHYAFQLMVAVGMLLITAAVVYLLSVFKYKDWSCHTWFMSLFALLTPLGFLAVEAGWTVTEVGRQPWIIQGVMKTAEAVTPMPGIIFSFYAFSGIYVSLAFVVCLLLFRQIKALDVELNHDFNLN